MNLQKTVSGVVVVVLVLALVNAFFVLSITSKMSDRFAEFDALTEPAKVSLITIKSSCSDCFDVSEVLKALKESSRLEILEEKTLGRNSQDAKVLISKYAIAKLPAIILQGDIGKVSVQGFKKFEDALAFTGVTAPYQDAETGEVSGKIKVIVLGAKQCKECRDLGASIDSLKKSGVYIAEEQNIDVTDSKAKEIVNKFGLTKLPALLISKDIDAYPTIAQSLKQAGAEKEGYYTIESMPPYVDAATGKTRGLLSVILLKDDACKECYDVGLHKQILTRMGLAVSEEKEVDISSDEGKAIVKEYTITKVPTEIIKGDVDAYDFFKQIWSQAGSIEEDGAYVFRHLSVLGPGIKYKDLKTGEVVENPQPQAQQQTPTEGSEQPEQ